MIIQMQQTRQIDVCTQQSNGNISTIPNCRLIQWRRRFGEQPPTECYSSKTNAQTTKIAGTKNIKFVIFAKWQNDASRHYIAIHGAQCARLLYCLLPSRLYFPAPAWTACLRCFHVYLFGLFREKKIGEFRVTNLPLHRTFIRSGHMPFDHGWRATNMQRHNVAEPKSNNLQERKK